MAKVKAQAGWQEICGVSLQKITGLESQSQWKEAVVYNLLYVENDLWVHQSMIEVLSSRYNVLTARDAGRALETIRECERNGQAIDLIILDISLSYSPQVPDPNNGKTSGVEFARLLKRDLHSTIPIVCYTVTTNMDVYTQLSKLGVKEIVSKTKGIRDLIEVIQKYLP